MGLIKNDTIKRKVTMLLMAAICVVAMAVPTFAESPSSGTANTAVTGAMASLAGDMVATGNALIPTALTVVGIAMVVTFGVRIFKSIARP